ncbi:MULTISPECIES: 2-keto-4-pentenoate hydratase [Prauserella salsuginis group]|uniref:2-keto-4-pentenoate hydratase n=1 Tax=Prauserella salsuginis TaxID=387889 RepID=A0ABW6G0M9_9PSEU|nr:MULTISPECIES: 2-keto-4-pentenoate hydratase [Prauserella salsuginis group]MCR3721915.1 2-keto-4-pentenoate hydratase [Prauserella flava]MCR3735920.1 2-keto-4-pentenoate hydratase [Prauserella salsuginis]
MDADEVTKTADRLLAAYASGSPTHPVIADHPAADLDDAYAIQQAQVEEWTRRGDVIGGHKVGLASRAIQRQMNVDQPDFGHLTRSMFKFEHEPIPASTYLQPRIEPETAFVLGKTLQGPGVTIADAVRAVEFVLPALEIVDSRISDWNISIVDTVADNASSGGVILGSRPVALADVDLRLVGCTLHRNGELVETGAGGAVLGSPLNSLVWLANTVGPHGVALEPGHVILPGSMTKATPMEPGDTVVSTTAGLGTVTAVLGAKEEQAV